MQNVTQKHTRLFETLRSDFGDRFSTTESVRQHHGQDESYYPHALPDAVLYPESNDEVVRVVKACADARCPIIPYGAGSSLEGHVLAVHGGLSVDLSRMNRILQIHPEDMDCTVQAGVTRKSLNHELNGTGLFFPIDPGADATIGGMAATRASGTNAVRYGTMRENVLGVTAVMPNGELVRTARRARKSSAGYDLTRLLVGSEGTLGIITEVQLKLHGRPDAVQAAVAAFPSIDAAVQTVIQTIQMGVPIARIELLDEAMIDAVNRFSGFDYDVCPTLFFEFHGTEASVREQVETVQELAAEHGAAAFRWAARSEERKVLWQARHDAYFATLALRPGCRVLSTDVCVPISALAECIGETREDLKSLRSPVTLVGHVGDGNFHLLVLLDPDDEEEVAEAKAMNERLVRRALALDGTCTGEHGIGIGKQQWLLEEHGVGVGLMRTLKQAIDPRGIMNPGKLLPDESPPRE